jgi:hypothetical protein
VNAEAVGNAAIVMTGKTLCADVDVIYACGKPGTLSLYKNDFFQNVSHNLFWAFVFQYTEDFDVYITRHGYHKI